MFLKSFFLNKSILNTENYLKTYNNTHYIITFSNSGIYNFEVPFGVKKIFTKLWGSGGGSTSSGAGGYSEGFFNVTQFEILKIEVGSPNIFLLNNFQNQPPAGGRSSIYRISQLNEIIVAGGGGSEGGAGGGLTGQNSQEKKTTKSFCGSTKANGAGGGTQNSGGTKGTATPYSGHYSTGVDGSRNYGSRGWGKNNWHEGYPGGGGYFGGGSGAATCYARSGGGGGSGYLSSQIYFGKTVTGNFEIPGNSNDILRNSAGNPNSKGVVILIFQIQPEKSSRLNITFNLFLLLFNILFEKI